MPQIVEAQRREFECFDQLLEVVAYEVVVQIPPVPLAKDEVVIVVQVSHRHLRLVLFPLHAPQFLN